MYHKIYFGNKPLFLCDAIDRTIEPFVHHDDVVFIDELNTHTVKAMIHEMQQSRVHAGVFYHTDLEKLKNTFSKKFSIVVAAGGAVINEKKELLMIFRKGKWDLPKGKTDKGESIEESALREVKEETGLKEVTLIHPITTTYHTYQEGTRFIMKETYWYKMKASAGQILKPQTEEDILEIVWVNKSMIRQYLENTYPSVQEVIALLQEFN